MKMSAPHTIRPAAIPAMKPAGLAHRLIESSSGFSVAGAYRSTLRHVGHSIPRQSRKRLNNYADILCEKAVDVSRIVKSTHTHP